MTSPHWLLSRPEFFLASFPALHPFLAKQSWRCFQSGRRQTQLLLLFTGSARLKELPLYTHFTPFSLFTRRGAHSERPLLSLYIHIAIHSIHQSIQLSCLLVFFLLLNSRPFSFELLVHCSLILLLCALLASWLLLAHLYISLWKQPHLWYLLIYLFKATYISLHENVDSNPEKFMIAWLVDRG